MVSRVLVANRGEIAIRVIRGCRELGLETVAVYSEADEGAPHLTAAHQAVPIGPAPAADSYLAIDRLIDAARRTGADAVHPGYGFLAENAGFASACRDAGLVFIGPPPEAIEQMGSKVESRRRAARAGLPVVPGDTPSSQDDASIREAAARVGFPLLVKASAGGGGKGMRVVDGASGLDEAVAAARHEARTAFGDDTLYLERLLVRPRHVEVQVLGDAHGQVVHLFERDCSTQRRHQKIIEESPSPLLSPALRARMSEAAVALARDIGYQSVGTVEFLVEGSGDAATFYFLEMNTRLQVEHPVTEAVTGVDLVHAQLRVAAGEPLTFTQAEIPQRGHALECRVYAEDPSSGFLPQAGRLAVYREPQGPGIRVDAGVVEGSVVSVYYDPLLSKLVAWGPSRDVARQRAVAALRRYPVLGVRTNIAFLIRVLEHEAFREGRVDTAFLDHEGQSLCDDLAGPGLSAALAVAAVSHAASTGQVGRPDPDRAADPWERLRGWRQ